MQSQHGGKVPRNRHLLCQLVRHGAASRLIGIVHPVPEGRGFEVIGDGGVVRFQRFQLFGEDIDHSEQGVGREAVPVGQQPDAVKRAVQDAVAVYTQEFFHSASDYKNPSTVYHKKDGFVKDFPAK